MIVIINEKGFTKHDEELVLDKDYMLIDGTSGGGSQLYRYRGVKVEDGIQMPELMEEEDVSLEKKDRSFERHINSKGFREGVLSVMAYQIDEELDKNFFIVYSDMVFEQYGEAIYEAFIDALGLDNDNEAPYILLYKNVKKKDKDSAERDYFDNYFMKWIRKDIKESTKKAVKKAMKKAFEKDHGDSDDASLSYKERKSGKKKKKDVDLETITVKKDKKKKKDKKDKDKKDKKKKKNRLYYDGSGLKDIKKEMKRISKGITLD